MGKYLIAILLFIAALAGLLLYIGEVPRLSISSDIGDSGKNFLGFEPVSISWQAAIVIATLSVLCFTMLLALLGWLWRLPSRLKSGHGLRRGAKAMDAVEDALLAGASGDAAKARKKAARAQELVKSPTLGHLIRAQTAEASGDHSEAITQYEALLKNEDTRSTAQQGLVRQYSAQGLTDEVISRTSDAFFNDKPSQWAFDPLFRAYVDKGEWKLATEALSIAMKRGWIDKNIARRRRAVLMTAEAQRLSVLPESSAELIKDLTITAASESPDFAPASAFAASVLSKQGDVKKAAKLIEKAWSKDPHPALALAYRDLFETKTPQDRAKRIESLVKHNPSHRESQILQIEASVETDDYVQAWSLISPMLVENPSARLCALAAHIERGLSNDTDSRIWLERGLSAPMEADWSDLDPKGTGFNYRVRDWQALVYSFGEAGELIHPRLTEGRARRHIVSSESLARSKPVAAKVAKPKEADDAEPVSLMGNKAQAPKVVSDIAERLDNLLGKTPKS